MANIFAQPTFAKTPSSETLRDRAKGRKFVIAKGYLNVKKLELKLKCKILFIGHFANRSVTNNQFCQLEPRHWRPTQCFIKI